MKNIIFLDLDATLWLNEQIPLSASSAIFQAKHNGHKIFVNTGRTKGEAIVPLLPLKLDGYCFSAGSEIYIGDKTLIFDPLQPKDAKSMTQFLLNHHVGVSLEGSEKTYLDAINKAIFLQRIQVHPQAQAIQRFLAMPSIDQVREEDYAQFTKLYLCNPHAVSVSIIQQALTPNCELTMFGLDTGEITNIHHNKGTAIQDVKNYYGNAYRTIAFGDSENDLTMFEAADIAIAMGNAKPEIQKKADYVTKDIRKHGLYHAFKYFDLI
ncbi:MAG: HAD-IIB family hydrolase [Absicoccus sp.]|uniref:HAD family hydrolase n=1 Tax=Absicoccus intestinalis TaxID=2926319 RepID=A0ABU4WNU5_9FIRM|nr:MULTISPECIES: HAD-IIB family hydrolase [unclassified Absicoccus]MDX8418236.1 HAD family hydrolase [Absicoccus sp. CLA-KB-P134]MDY3034604.1 HAD-IIB family hydrolase [Absicoccus sp.]